MSEQTKSAKKSVHLTADTMTYIEGRTHYLERDHLNVSGSLNAAVEMLRWLAKSSIPSNLYDEDWTELRSIYAGSDMSRLPRPLNIARDLLDHYGATVPKQLPAECRPLLDKLADYTQAEQFAILDAVRVFWACAGLDDWDESDSLYDAVKRQRRAVNYG